MRSCTDLYKSGARNSGIYYLIQTGALFKVHCDFESEANSTWTLVMSYALKNKAQFAAPLSLGAAVKGSDPNWEAHRYQKFFFYFEREQKARG